MLMTAQGYMCCGGLKSWRNKSAATDAAANECEKGRELDRLGTISTVIDPAQASPRNEYDPARTSVLGCKAAPTPFALGHAVLRRVV